MKSLSLSQPHALIMVGIPGSGKSTFAEKFSSTFGAPKIDLDEILLHAQNAAAADELLMLQLQELIKTKASVVVEANASSKVRRNELSKYLKDAGYEPLFVWMQTDTETAKQRTQRAKKLDKSTYEANVRRFTAPHDNENVLVLSGKHTYASQAKIVLKRLSAPREEVAARPEPAHRAGRITIQ